MLSTDTLKKTNAIELRKRAKSYNEISAEIGVSKSTLSYWLRELELPEETKKILKKKRLLASKKGAEARHKQKINKINTIEILAARDIKEITDSELWMMGIILYWAEGNKEKSGGRSERVSLSNSDPRIMYIFKYWLTKIINIPESELIYELYIHQNNQQQEKILSYWSNKLEVDKKSFSLYQKKNIVKTKKYKEKYYGLVRIKVRKSTDLNRKISGWVKAIYKSFYSRVV